ncbi:FAD-binding protein [Myxococcota bacterium]|nr:FAD-binding protein [Myxococcota bacterium]MBU1510250.1 FAD-binding protein [Myxococcota bacterium]
MMQLDELLLRELGPGIVSLDPDLLRDCSHDESEQEAVTPEVAVTPVDPLQVEILLRLAGEHRFFVTPRGAGTGKSGGSVPVRGGVSLSLHRMNHILEIDPENLLAVVEPGATCESLQQAAWAAGLFYPPDPASLATCSLGGNVAENAGGPRAFRYGVTREYVLGMEAVRIGGQRFDVGHRPVKGVSGYDLAALLTGSEGTLAVFTKLIFKLIPQPEAPGLLILYFPSVHEAVRAVTILVQNRLFPMALELLDRPSLDAARTETFSPSSSAGGALFCELEGLASSPHLAQAVLDALAGAGAAPSDHELAADPAAAATAWDARRDVSSRLKALHARKISEDVAVPRALLPELVLGVREIAAELDLESACYGHAGDGNLHVNFLTDGDGAAFGTAVERLFRLTLLLGGTLSGEHGIGTIKRRFLPAEHAPAVLDMFAAVKHAWDPAGLLNPGKVL